MPSEERNTWVSLFSSLIVNAWFFRLIWVMFGDGTSTAPDALQLWARTVVWVVPVSIVSTIMLTIVASIVQGIVTGEKSVIFLKDERDTKFGLWGLGATMLLAVVGFLSAMAALALGYSGFIAFNLIYLGFCLGDLAGSLVKLGLYRCGI